MNNRILVLVLAISVAFHVLFFYYYMGFKLFTYAPDPSLSTEIKPPPPSSVIITDSPPSPHFSSSSSPHDHQDTEVSLDSSSSPSSPTKTNPPPPPEGELPPPSESTSSKFVSSYDYKSLKLPDAFHQCIAEEEAHPVEEKTSPPLSIVVTSSLDHVNVNGDEFDMASANLRCYTQLHGFNHFTNLISNANVKESSHFFGKRWQTLYDRYILHAPSKWVFQMDADTIVANLSKPIFKYLDTKAEIILHFRRNLEVIAGMVGFRAASPFARCFLKRWVSYGASQANWDNGDLLQLLLDIVDPALADRCRPQRNSFSSFVACFTAAVPKFRDLENTLPIKIYFPFSGLWRSLECWLGEDRDPNIFRHCVDDDLFVHGWKDIGSKHITPAIYKCDANNPELYGPLKKCHWKTPNETLAFAKKCCYEAYRGCHQGDRNICTENNPACTLNNGVPEGYHTCRYQHMDCPDIPYD